MKRGREERGRRTGDMPTTSTAKNSSIQIRIKPIVKDLKSASSRKQFRSQVIRQLLRAVYRGMLPRILLLEDSTCWGRLQRTKTMLDKCISIQIIWTQSQIHRTSKNLSMQQQVLTISSSHRHAAAARLVRSGGWSRQRLSRWTIGAQEPATAGSNRILE